MDALERVAACTRFDWDAGNVLKNWEKHGVSVAECEQVFFNRPLVAATDKPHSVAEPRYFVLGHADSGRELFVVLTVRGAFIRVISARDMSQRERRSYRTHGKEKEANS